jgi:cbb3-type cytochrome oxidase maturation protein
MNGNFDLGILLLWLVSGALMMTGAAIAFFWALRSGQFRDRDRARYLALWSGIPEDEKREGEKPEKKGEKAQRHKGTK